MGIWVIETIKLLLFGCVVCFVLGLIVGFVFVKKPICIMKDRKKTLSSIPDLDMTLVNKKHILSYLSYDNRLLRLYKGPDKNRKLCVPEGIESIGEHAFDDFSVYDISNGKGKPRLKENISAIVLPSTIKNLNIDNIPRGTSLIFADARLKSILRNKENYLKSKEMNYRAPRRPVSRSRVRSSVSGP